MLRFRLNVLQVIFLAMIVPAAGCQPSPDYGRVVLHGRDARVDLVFSARDRAIIHDYYGYVLPPGLAKRERLPPGLRKHLVRWGELPPGLAGHRLPVDLERRLSRLPRGYLRLRFGTDVVLFHQDSRLILDVLTDVGP